MVGKQNKKRKKRIELDPYEVLDERVLVTAHELIQLIHQINPTNKKKSSKMASESYRLKARLQSMLIRQFKDSLQVELPDPENTQIVGLCLRHFNEDACHALINELDDDARSWTQRQIDEGYAGGSIDSTEFSPKFSSGHKQPSYQYPQNDKAGKRDEALSEEELVNLGQKALEEYEYDACEKYYLRALDASHGGLEPALAILDFFVDHLAAYEKALAISELFSTSTEKDKRVKSLLALAAAHCGQVEKSLDYIDRISDPCVVEVYLFAVRHFIQQGDESRAAELLSVLKSYENADSKPEIDELETKIISLKAKKIEPVEEEMIQAWQQGSSRDALDLADSILSLLPQNKAARKIRHEFEKQQREENITKLLRQADEAKCIDDFQTEADLLKRAIMLGANANDLTKDLEHAQNKAKKHKQEAEISNVVGLWKDGHSKKALLQFMGLNEKQRGRILNTIHDQHFVWLEQTFSTHTTMKDEKMADAILDLGKLKNALQKREDPQHIVAEMNLHSRALQSVSEARTILQQAKSLSLRLELKKNKELLGEADSFLAKENPDLEKASDCVAGIKVRDLDKSDRKYFEHIKSKMQRLDTIRMFNQKYDSCLKQGDHFACMDIAGKLAGYNEKNTSKLWFDKVEEHAASIKKEWSLVTADISELPTCYATFGMGWMLEESNCCILPDGRNLIMVTCHERWVFARTFCLDDQRFKKAIILRAPERLSFPKVSIVGNVLWIAGQDGHVVGLCLDPLTILSWYDFSDFIRQNEIVEDVLLFPEKGFVWLNKRSRSGILIAEETCEVINIEQWRVIRRIRSFALPFVINNSGFFHVVIANGDDKFVRIYSEQGRIIENLEFKTSVTIDAAAIHPNGVDSVFLTYDDTGAFNLFQDITEDNNEQYGDFILTLEIKPDVEHRNEPIKIEDSCGEFQHAMFTSLDTGIVFVCFGNESSQGIRVSLAAFKESRHGLDLLYQVSVPKDIILAVDEYSNRVAAIYSTDRKMQAVILDEHTPVFECDNDNSEQEYSLPSFDSRWTCGSPTGDINAESLAFMLQLRDYSYEEFCDAAEKIKQSNNPDKIAAFIYALERILRIEESKQLKVWMKERYPDNCRVLFDMANDAAREQDWEKVILLLAQVSRVYLDDGTARHICHLLGMAYFVKNDEKSALNIWEEGATYQDGQCELSPYIAYAKLSLMNEKERKQCKPKSDIQRCLDIYERVDTYFKNKKWHAVIETMELTDSLKTRDLQLQARLVQAYLHQNYNHDDMRFISKVIVLANYCEEYNNDHFRKNQALPHYIEMLTEDRLGQIARQASKWIEDGISG